MNDETRKERQITDGRDNRGRFGPGNKGRPPGSRGRANQLAAQILDDATGEVARKAIELAKDGNVAAIAIVLKLRLRPPRERADPLELPPLETAEDGLSALRLITEAAARAEIDTEHARALVSLVEAFLSACKILKPDETKRPFRIVIAPQDANL